MSNIDDRIRAALQAEGQDADDLLTEPGIRELMGDVFRGRLRWLNLFGWVVGVVLFGLSIYALVRFLQAEEMRQMILWGMALLFGVTAVGMMKIWFWMELQKNAILREIKRVELQLARLAAAGRNA